MPRSASGACSLAESAFIANTPIVAADANSNNDDIIDMLTDSLSRSGDGGMTAQLELHNDGFAYSTDPNTGMRRTAGDEQAIECGGVDIVEFTSTGMIVNGDLEVTGDITLGGNPLLMVGAVWLWTSTVIPAKWLAFGQTLLRASYPDLWTYAAAQIALGNTLFTNGNGTTTFTLVATAGYAPVDVDATSTTLPSVTHIGDGTGNKTATLLTANMPVTTPAGTIAGSVTSVFQNITAPAVGATHMVIGAASGDGATGAGNTLAATFTGTPFGSATPVAIVQPSRAFKFIIYAGA